MSTIKPDNVPASPEEELHAELERRFIDDYLRRKGVTVEGLKRLPEDEAHRIMSEASIYASGKLAEIESREHTRQNIKGLGQNEVS